MLRNNGLCYVRALIDSLSFTCKNGDIPLLEFNDNSIIIEHRNRWSNNTFLKLSGIRYAIKASYYKYVFHYKDGPLCHKYNVGLGELNDIIDGKKYSNLTITRIEVFRNRYDMEPIYCLDEEFMKRGYLKPHNFLRSIDHIKHLHNLKELYLLSKRRNKSFAYRYPILVAISKSFAVILRCGFDHKDLLRDLGDILNKENFFTRKVPNIKVRIIGEMK